MPEPNYQPHMPEPARRRPGTRRRDPLPEVDREIVVLKFGSSILASEGHIANAVHEVYREVRAGRRVVVVCSAMGDTTNRLIARAGEITDKPHPAAYAALLAVGESQSSAQVALAVDAAGMHATLLDPAQIDFRTSGDPVDAEPASMDPDPITRALADGSVVVLPGFAGRDERGFTTLLGRGGTDLSALFIAHHIGAARCRLAKDVDGWYDGDPKAPGGARKFARLSYEDAIASPAKVVQPKCVRYACDHKLPIEVGALGSDLPTVVCAEGTVKVDDPPASGPIRVALLGLGTVGGGVMRHLLALPGRYQVVRVLVRDPAPHADKLADPSILTSDPDAAFEGDPELVVEVMGGTGLAGELVGRVLGEGRSVVTANKALIAARGVGLRALAESKGATLAYSAAVGGGVPMLENLAILAREHEISSIVGVLNGTTNFILDHLARGSTYDHALDEAKRLGFAEADPSADVCGHDAAQKLCLLSRLAFDPELPIDAVEVSGLDHLASDASEPGRGMVRRLVARASRTDDGGVFARVALEEVPEGSELARVRDEHNLVIVRLSDGRRALVGGRGAGRWPTAESVFGDVEAYARARMQAARG
ncbi:MAG: homoserine dehydrogenase [Phycisphaerales bacterium]